MVKTKDYKQEACLGRVKTRAKNSEPFYLIKWVGYDTLEDITAEPASNVHVPKKEEPVLDQNDKKFLSDLTTLWKTYKDECAKDPVDKKLEEYVQESKKRPLVSTSTTPPKKAKTEVETVVVNSGTYRVTRRQYICISSGTTEQDGFRALFLKINSAKMNPGISFTLEQNIKSMEDSRCPCLCASVDNCSVSGGFGWFYHESSGLSIDGMRYCGAAVPLFTEGDEIGIVVNTAKSEAYCIKNNEAVVRISFKELTAHHMTHFVFAVHLCPLDAVTVISPSKPLSELCQSSCRKMDASSCVPAALCANCSSDAETDKKQID